MSRGYRVRVRRGVRVSDQLDVDCTAGDEVRTRVEVLEILPREQMAGLLAGELARRGFAEHGGRLERTADGVTVTVDPATGDVTVRAESAGRVRVEGSRAADVTDWAGQRRTEDRLREELRRDLRRQAERQAQEQVSGQLEAALGDVAAELDRAVNRVTAEALKQKAAQIGRVKELAEDPDSGSLSITVEV